MTRRRKVVASLAAVLGLIGTLLVSGPAEAIDLVEGRVKVNASGKFLAKSGTNAVQSSTGISVTIRPATAGSSEHTIYGWDGTTGWCLTGSASTAPANNTAVTWAACTWRVGPQRWLVESVAAQPGAVQLVNVPNGKALNLANGSTAEGARLSLYTRGSWVTELYTLVTSSGGGTTPTPTPTTPPTPPAGGVNTMPASAPAGFTRAFGEEFLTDQARGTWPGTYASRMQGYDCPDGRWVNGTLDTTQGCDTRKTGRYDRKRVVSAAGGVMRYDVHTAAGWPRVAAEGPATNNGGTYGRYTVRARQVGAMPGYKNAWLLWPYDGDWDKGEMNFPEHGLEANAQVSGFNHCIGNPRNNCHAFTANHEFDDGWATYTMDWRPGVLIYEINGVEVSRTTNSVPATPFRWALQTETALDGSLPSASVAETIEIDWLTIDRRA